MISRTKRSEVIDTGLQLKVDFPVSGGINLSTTSAETPLFASELMDEVIKEPTLDIYLDRSPKLNQPKDYEEMVKILQRKRAAFINAEQKRKEPKDNGED